MTAPSASRPHADRGHEAGRQTGRGTGTADGRAVRRTVPRLMNAAVIAVQAMVSGVNLAVPQLSGSGLHPSATQLVWIVDVYLLVFAGLLIPAGALGDRLGRKPVLLSGLAVFGLGCLGCALSPNVTALIVNRAVAGVGAALVMPATLALSLSVTPPPERGRAVGAWSGATGLGGMLGNLIAGTTLQFFSWPVFFALFVPAAVLLAVLAGRWAPDTERHPVRPDAPGAVLLVATLTALLFGLIEGRELGWTSTPVLAAFAAAAVIGALFVVHSLRSDRPLVDLRLLRTPAVGSGTLGVAGAFLGMFSLFFLNSQYLHYAKGFSAVQTGLAILPQGLCMKLVSPRAARLAARWGTRRVVAAGLTLIVAGLVLLSLATSATPYWSYATDLLVMAAGMGLATPPLSSGIVAALPRSQSGLGAALNSTAREIGSAIGIAVVATIVTSRFLAHLPPAVATHAHSASDAMTAAGHLGAAQHTAAVHAFTDAMTQGYRVIAALVAVTALVVLRWQGRARRTTTGTGQAAP
ncbi:MFS transporter [Streptomyces sp. NPDC001393]